MLVFCRCCCCCCCFFTLQFDVQVYLKLGPARVVIPVHISHIQYKALARVVLNMVDTIPCIGGQGGSTRVFNSKTPCERAKAGNRMVTGMKLCIRACAQHGGHHPLYRCAGWQC
jgi:hypothetical protein